MTKAELIDAILQKTDFPTKVKAEEALNAVVEAITDCLIAGDSITLTGFGSFKVSERAARKGCNPRTKEPIDIPASKAVKFTPGKQLKDAVNN